MCLTFANFSKKNNFVPKKIDIFRSHINHTTGIRTKLFFIQILILRISSCLLKVAFLPFLLDIFFKKIKLMLKNFQLNQKKRNFQPLSLFWSFVKFPWGAKRYLFMFKIENFPFPLNAYFFSESQARLKLKLPIKQHIFNK